MPVKLGYKSIDESGVKAMSRKKVINRLRSMKLFGKREGDDHDVKKLDNEDTFSTSETTAELSPVKGEETESYDDKFDLYFAPAYLPHISVTEKDELDELVEKPSIHTRAFTNAIEMEVPPAPPQKARTRNKSTTSKAESLKPKNLSFTFAQNADKPKQSNALHKTKQQILSFGTDLIEAVEHSHSDFNLILQRISSDKKSSIEGKIQLSEKVSSGSHQPNPKKSEDATEPETATSDKKPTVPKTMDDIKGYISQLRAGASSNAPDTEEPDSIKKYQQIIKNKMGSIARTFSYAAPDVTQASATCEANMCNFMEAATELMNPTLNQSGYVSPTPLNQIELDEDSDSVSKLTMPFHISEQSLSMVSDVHTDIVPAVLDASATKISILSHDWD